MMPNVQNDFSESKGTVVALQMAYYNFCWRPDKMRVTLAMAAVVTTTLSSLEQLLAEGLA